MIPRTVTNLVLCSTVFVAPLAMHPSRLTTPAPWLGLAVALTMMLSQPPLPLREASSRFAVDRGSAIGIFAAMIGTQLVAVLGFAARTQTPSPWTFAAGAVIAVSGLSLRLTAIHTLGRFFTTTVRVAGDQTVIRNGPYRWLRHPSYTGALIAAFGQVIALESAVGFVLIACLCIPAYLYRIAVEERALATQLGEAYVSYRAGTWGLVPGIR